MRRMFRNIICSPLYRLPMTTINNTCKYKCELCDYVTSRKSQYDRHLNTRKHILITNGLRLGTHDYTCECGKEYSCRQNLYRHKQKCKGVVQEQTQVPPPVDSSLVIELLKQNQEFKELMIEQHKRMTEQQDTIIELSNIIGTHTTINTNS